MHLTLYRKYRPMDFQQVAGEEEIIHTIKNSLKKNRMAHAYLFTGPRGVGKTTTARLIAKGLNCLENGITDSPCNECDNCRAINSGNFIDLIEIDAASNRGIDEIRSLKDKINYQPVKGRKKVYIIDEVHMLTKEAFNALLKTLEEPPSHVIFILATTEPDKVLDTIISRCQRYDFKPLSFAETKSKLIEIAEKEGVTIDEESLKLIYERAGGSMRDAISIFERLISTYLGEEIVAPKTERALGVIPKKLLEEFLDILDEKNLQAGMEFLDGLWENSVNVEVFFKDFANFLKESVFKGEKVLGLERCLFSIEKIFDILSKFKYEEDKRLLGYVVLYHLSGMETMKRTVPQAKVAEEAAVEEKATEIKQVSKGSHLNIQDVREKWGELIKRSKSKKITLIALLNGAQPIRVDGNILYVGFTYDNQYSKTAMEKPQYHEVFLETLREVYSPEIEVRYEVVNDGRTVEQNTETDSFVEKVVDFFDGEIMS